MSGFYKIGQCICGGIAWVVMTQTQWSCPASLTLILNGSEKCGYQSNIGWRIFYIVSASIVLIWVASVHLFFPLYESPRYLLTKKKYEEAVDVLKNVAWKNGKEIDITAKSFIELEAEITEKSNYEQNRERLKILFNSELGATTTILWLIYFTVALGK